MPEPSPQPAGVHVHDGPGPREPGLWPPTWPMGLTMLRLLLLPVFLWVMLLDAGGHEAGEELTGNRNRWWAVAIFAVMALTDKLDGYLARRLNQTSKIGTILDPLADKLLIASSVVLLSFDWAAGAAYRIPPWVVLAVYGKDVVVALGTVAILASVGKVSVAPRLLGKLGTFFQLLLVMLTLLAPDLDRLMRGSAGVVLTGLWWVVTAISIGAMGDYVRIGILQYRMARVSAQPAAV